MFKSSEKPAAVTPTQEGINAIFYPFFAKHFFAKYFRNDSLEDRYLLPWLLPADTLDGSRLIIQGICLAKLASSMCSSSLASPSDLVHVISFLCSG